MERRVQWATLLMAATGVLLAARSVAPNSGGWPWWLLIVAVLASLLAAWAVIGLVFETPLRRVHSHRTGQRPPEASHHLQRDGRMLLRLDLRDHEPASRVRVRLRLPSRQWVDIPADMNGTVWERPYPGPGAVVLPPGRYHVKWFMGSAGGNFLNQHVASDRFKVG